MDSKRVLDHLLPTVKAFAEKKGGNVSRSVGEIAVRLQTGSGLFTIQVLVLGKAGDQKIEVVGVRRSGIEGRKFRIPLPEDLSKVDLQAVSEALFKSLKD